MNRVWVKRIPSKKGLPTDRVQQQTNNAGLSTRPCVSDAPAVRALVPGRFCERGRWWLVSGWSSLLLPLRANVVGLVWSAFPLLMLARACKVLAWTLSIESNYLITIDIRKGSHCRFGHLSRNSVSSRKSCYFRVFRNSKRQMKS